MAGRPRDDSYNFKAYYVDGGKACEMVISLNKDEISIDGVRRTWHQAREIFQKDARPIERNAREAESRRATVGTA